MLLALTVMFASCELTGEEMTTASDITAEAVVPETTAESEITAPETEAEETTAAVTEETTAEVTTEVIEETTAEATTEAITEAVTTAPAETTEPPHEHAWSTWSTVTEATCIKAGKQERSCSCGEKESQTLQAIGHKETVIKGYAATCTASGLTDGKRCTVCGDMLVQQNAIPSVGHNEMVENGYAATCTASGLTNGKRCIVCGVMTVKQNAIPALGHKETVEKGYAATCTASGLTDGKYCLTCGVMTVKRNIIPAVGHTEVVDKGYASTCTSYGLSDGKHCTVCGDVTDNQIVLNMLAHNEVIQKAKAATCTESGLTEGRYCSDCGKVMAVQTVVPATGHTPVVVEGMPSSCTVSGNTDWSYCSSCGKTLIQSECLPYLPHDYIETLAIPATCTTEGRTYGCYCSVCGYAPSQSRVVPAKGHSCDIIEGYAPSCMFTGLSNGEYCYRCDKMVVEQKEIAALEHNIVNDECSLCGFMASIPDEYVNATNGYITSATTTIKTKHLIFEIDSNVYVMDNFVEIVDLVTDIMQDVSGMKFAGISPYCTDTGTATHAKVTVVKPEGSECGPAEAYYYGGSVISACDIVDFFALIHENSHVLHFRQSAWAYGTVLMESISTYTTYKTSCVIYENYPELSLIVGTPSASLGNYYCGDYSMFYEYSIEEWMDNSLGHDSWNRYIVGFHFARYLDEVYGDYTKWIYTYEAYNHFNPFESNMVPAEEQVKALKMAYGDDVLDGFYPWIRANEERLHEFEITDMSAVDELDLYPTFMAWEDYSTERSVKYSKLCIDLSGGMYYLNEYQDRDISALKADISVEGSANIYLYGADGSFIRAERVSEIAELDLSGVYYIIIGGEGMLRSFNITGFEK